MKLETLPVIQGEYNLQNYRETYENFDWKEVEKQFSWAETGLVNMAHEAIDKHANSYRKNKVALYYRDANRNEKYTFQEMKDLTNKAGNVLKTYGDVEKGDRVFIFMPRSPELYFTVLGAIKAGSDRWSFI